MSDIPTHHDMRPGLHPSHVTEMVPSLQGGSIRLTAAVSDTVDIWGQLEGNGRPLYPPHNPDKSIAKYGGVEGYKNSPERELFHHITTGQYLSFSQRARKYFTANTAAAKLPAKHEQHTARPKAP